MPLFGPPNIAQMEAKRDAQGLIKALAYKDVAIRIAAADALAPLKDPLAVEPLAALLKDDDTRVRLASVAALAARGGFRVVDPLVTAMEDRDPEVRSAAETAVFRRLMTDPDQDTRRATATALGRIHSADAVEPLIKAVMDADESVRAASIKALHAIGDVAAVLPLIMVLAHEQVRLRATGRSSLIVERAASQALDALCDARAIESLQAALAHSDFDVREIAVRRLARVGSPEVADTLASALGDSNSVISRSAARGLEEMGWNPPADETGARYWIALRQWQRSAECGGAAIPLLVASFDQVDASERMEIVAALAQLEWEPPEADSIAAYYWAAQRRWDKCIEIGPPAVEALDVVLRSSPKWRDRIATAAALAALGADPGRAVCPPGSGTASPGPARCRRRRPVQAHLPGSLPGRRAPDQQASRTGDRLVRLRLPDGQDSEGRPAGAHVRSSGLREELEQRHDLLLPELRHTPSQSSSLTASRPGRGPIEKRLPDPLSPPGLRLRRGRQEHRPNRPGDEERPERDEALEADPPGDQQGEYDHPAQHGSREERQKEPDQPDHQARADQELDVAAAKGSLPERNGRSEQQPRKDDGTRHCQPRRRARDERVSAPHQGEPAKDDQGQRHRIRQQLLIEIRGHEQDQGGEVGPEQKPLARVAEAGRDGGHRHRPKDGHDQGPPVQAADGTLLMGRPSRRDPVGSQSPDESRQAEHQDQEVRAALPRRPQTPASRR